MENKKYYLYANKQRVEVTKEVYIAYYQSIEQEKYQEKKIKKYKVMSYNALDTDEQTGEETLADPNAQTIEEGIIFTQTIEKLRKSLDLLTKDEMELIQGLFYRGVSLRGLSEESNIPLNTLKYRKDKILRKLKKLLED